MYDLSRCIKIPEFESRHLQYGIFFRNLILYDFDGNEPVTSVEYHKTGQVCQLGIRDYIFIIIKMILKAKNYLVLVKNNNDTIYLFLICNYIYCLSLYTYVYFFNLLFKILINKNIYIIKKILKILRFKKQKRIFFKSDYSINCLKYNYSQTIKSLL